MILFMILMSVGRQKSSFNLHGCSSVFSSHPVCAWPPFFWCGWVWGSRVSFQITVSITANWLHLNPLVMEKSIPGSHQNILQPMEIQNVTQRGLQHLDTGKSFWWQSEEDAAEARQETVWSWRGSDRGRTTLGQGHTQRTAAMSGYGLMGLWPWVTHSRAGRNLKDCVHRQPKLGHWEVEVAEENHEDTRSGGKPEFRRRRPSGKGPADLLHWRCRDGLSITHRKMRDFETSTREDKCLA